MVALYPTHPDALKCHLSAVARENGWQFLEACKSVDSWEIVATFRRSARTVAELPFSARTVVTVRFHECMNPPEYSALVTVRLKLGC